GRVCENQVVYQRDRRAGLTRDSTVLGSRTARVDVNHLADVEARRTDNVQNLLPAGRVDVYGSVRARHGTAAVDHRDRAGNVARFRRLDDDALARVGRGREVAARSGKRHPGDLGVSEDLEVGLGSEPLGIGGPRVDTLPPSPGADARDDVGISVV